MPFDTAIVHNGAFLGLNTPIAEATVVFLPVPWDATTSYRNGAALGPNAILQASYQLDWYDPDVANAWDIGHGTVPIDPDILALNTQARLAAQVVIQHQEQGGQSDDSEVQAELAIVNQTSERVNEWVYQQTKSLLAAGKRIGLVGGDHSSPYGYIKALTEQIDAFGILQIDAHADLLQAFEGFTYSHASIMYNVLQFPQITHLVQVGVRAIGADEIEWANQAPRIHLVTDWQLKTAAYTGTTWASQCAAIIQKLPDYIYISFDIDGLRPQYCPHTGTPVPGGLDFSEAVYLLQQVHASGKHIIGFDLCEVAPGPDPEDEWDGNVGARLLYKLANLMYASR